MKVYVEKLPKSPNDCIFQVFIAYHKNGWEHHERYCSIMKNELTCKCSKEDCPLKDISDYTKQVRKEVCEKFVEEFMLEYTMGNEPVEDIIYKVSDRIQGE